MQRSRIITPLLIATLSWACSDHGLKVHEDPPTATLLDPADFDTFIVGMSVSFEAQLDDKDDGVGSLDLQWKSSAQGTLHGDSTLDGKVMEFVTDELEIGTHTVTVTATDPDGHASEDSVEIIIIANTAPSIAFDSPSEGAAFVELEPIAVRVQVSDTEDPVEALRLNWTLDDASVTAAPTHPDAAGFANHEIAGLTEGQHTISVTVTDTLGENSQASIAVLVLTDGDGDGFGAVEFGGTDCDDNDASISPEADEVCDEIDNDCDDLVDDDDDDLSDGFTGHPDTDDDGYGDETITVITCDPEDLGSTDGDCDDTDPNIHPGKADIPYDGIDQDCDGSDLTDVDDDGHEAIAVGGDDCDDTDPSVHPGAAETCDEIDNDCDDLIDAADDDLSDGFTGHPDVDEDGYADGTRTVSTCDPEDLGSIDGDCDDTDPLVHPEADEVCDEIDNDCDDLVDLDDDDLTDAFIGYVDMDGDGYGDESTSVWACDPSGLSDTPGDCNDLDSSTHPGAYEICGDGIDNDCDGTPGDCNWSGEIVMSLADHKSWGETADDEIATSLAAGDLDGDGLTDLVVGASLADPTAMNSGAVYLLSGGMAMTTGTIDSHAAWALDGVTSLDKAGAAIGLTDLDDDGAVDLLVGAPQADAAASGTHHGLVYVFHGPVTDGGSLDEAHAVIEGEGGGDKLGSSIIGDGDIDGDGLPDLIVGAPYDHELASDAGAAYLFLGSGTPWSGSISAADKDTKFVSDSPNTRLSEAICFAGDVNGDGRDDLLIGAPGGAAHGYKTGHVVLFLGHATHFGSGGTRVQNTADARYNGASSQDEAGSSVASLGDVDGDGYDEFAVGAIGTDTIGHETGTLYMMIDPDITGSHELEDVADIQLWGTRENGHLGMSLSARNDLNNDGIDDLVVTAPKAATNRGHAYLLYGPIDEIESGELSGDSGIEDAVFVGEHIRDYAGKAVLGGSDWNDDGIADLAIAVPGITGGTDLADSGGVSVFFGSGL